MPDHFDVARSAVPPRTRSEYILVCSAATCGFGSCVALPGPSMDPSMWPTVLGGTVDPTTVLVFGSLI